MSKTFSYEANTTTSTIQYNVTASIGSLSQEKTFSVPAGDECQDNYVLSAPSTVYYGSTLGSDTSISITSTLNGKYYPYSINTDNLTGASVSSPDENGVVITANEENNAEPTLRGSIIITQTQKDGKVNTREIDVYQKGYVRLGITSTADMPTIFSNRPLPCNLDGVISNNSYSLKFSMHSSQDNTTVAMPFESGLSITSANLRCANEYDLFY